MSREQQAPFVLTLDDVSATLERVGGKGASLARLVGAGLPVPPGFHITTAAYRRFVEENGLQDQILAAVSSVSADQPSQLEEASGKITGLFARSEMPRDIAEAIGLAYANLGSDLPVAVRSSATAEDLPEMSFAGQQETYLNMHGKAMVLDAVKRCWASLWTARAIGYRAIHAIAPQDVSLAVVVQELVPADAAGILFTANPMTGVREQVMINAAWGLGEAIVGGLVTPDMIVVDKASGKIVTQEINEKDVMTVRIPEGTHEEPVPVDRRKQPVLSAEQAAELARVGTRIEELYGQPMDIEWVRDFVQIFVVQARPVTALPVPLDTTPIEWKLADPQGQYMRASVIELMPDPLSPLFATLGLPAWNNAMRGLIRTPGIVKVGNRKLIEIFDEYALMTINDYAYYDLTSMRKHPGKLMVLVPNFVGMMRFVLKTAKQRWEKEHGSYIDLVERWEETDLATASAEYLFNGAAVITNEAAKYYLTIQGGILPAAYMSELFFTMVYDKLIKRRGDPSAPTFVLGYDSEPIRAEKSLYDLAQWVRTQPELEKVLQEMAGPRFKEAYRADQVAGADQVVWSEFRQRFTSHLTHYGHTIYDLDFAKPLPIDDPAALFETLKFFLSGKATNPNVRQEKAAAKREQAKQEVLARLGNGLRARMFKRMVNWAQEMAPLREDALADVGLGWPMVRRMLHELGRRLVKTGSVDTQDDIFWLNVDEVQEAVHALEGAQTSTPYQDQIAERRARWKREQKVRPPVALPVKGGTRFLGIDFKDMMPERTEQEVGNVLKGIGASVGKVTGVARVIHGPGEFAQMQHGDILVARITTPAWTPLFALAAGVVTDVGGPLSHSSIVAREYHIPAVLGTGFATERLQSGQTITVDGDAGTVKIEG
jgi:pyruvate,water dikinase